MLCWDFTDSIYVDVDVDVEDVTSPQSPQLLTLIETLLLNWSSTMNIHLNLSYSKVILKKWERALPNICHSQSTILYTLTRQILGQVYRSSDFLCMEILSKFKLQTVRHYNSSRISTVARFIRSLMGVNFNGFTRVKYNHDGENVRTVYVCWKQLHVFFWQTQAVFSIPFYARKAVKRHVLYKCA